MTLSVIIPTLNSELSLPATLAAIKDAEEILVADGGSTDSTSALAASMGARVFHTERGRGHQLAAAAVAAAGDWLLFLHSDTVLETGWQNEVRAFTTTSGNASRAATFCFALDDPSAEARRLERWVAWRVQTFGLAYGDQGLLIQRDFYCSLGGYRPVPLMEDVDLIRRIGRRRLDLFHSKAYTSAERWRRVGWLRRSAANLGCLSLYFLGVPPRLIRRLYG